MSSRTSISRKRAYLNNAKLAREKNSKHQKAHEESSEESSTEELKSKKERLCDDATMEEMERKMAEEVAKVTGELNQVMRNRDELKAELAIIQGRLEEKEKRITALTENVDRLRAQQCATSKREKRMREKMDGASIKPPPRTDHPRISYTRFSKCDEATRKTRIDECLAAIRKAVGIDEEDAEYERNLKRVLLIVLDNLSMRTSFSVEEDAEFVAKFNLPDSKREEMRSFFRTCLAFDPFSHNAKVRECRKMFMVREDWNFEEFPDESGASDGKKGRQVAFCYYNTNIRGYLDSLIKGLVAKDKLILGEPYNGIITVVLMLDKGGSLTKCGVSLSNLRHKVGSPGNFHLLGVSSLSESYDNVKLAFAPVLAQVDALNKSSLEIGAMKLTYRVKCGGDYKAIALLLGHSGASSKFYCPSCPAVKTTMKTWDPRCKIDLREDYAIGTMSITRPSLLPSVGSADVVPPVNHILTGVVKKALKLLEKKIGVEAKEWTADEEEKLSDIRRELKLAADEIKSIDDMKMALQTGTNELDGNLEFDNFDGETSVAELEERETELKDKMMLLEMEQTELGAIECRTIEKLTEALAKLKLECGIYPRYYYGDLVGADARRVTVPENARKLWELVEDNETRDTGIALFDVIYALFSLLSATFQSDDEKTEFRRLLDRLQSLWSSLNPTESVTLKVHGLTHLADLMDAEGHAGREIELVENSHHVLNLLWPQYLSVTPLERRLYVIISRYQSKTALLLL